MFDEWITALCAAVSLMLILALIVGVAWLLLWGF